MALADDLDLLGHASLQHLLGYVGTPAGQTTLQGWMLTPATPDVIRARQEAAAELAPLLDFRDELATGGRHMDMTPAGLRGFLAWAEDEPWLTRRPLLIWLSRLLPLLLVGLIVAQFTGLLAGPWWLLAIGVNLLFNVVAGKQSRGIALARRRSPGGLPPLRRAVSPGDGPIISVRRVAARAG